MRRVGASYAMSARLLSNLIVVDGAQPARAGFVKQAIIVIPQKSTARHLLMVFMEAEFDNHILAWQAIRIAGSGGIAQIATAQHDDDELASLGAWVPAD